MCVYIDIVQISKVCLHLSSKQQKKNTMEKYFHLNTEQEDAGASLDAYTFLSSSPVGLPSLQSINHHKPLLPLLLFNDNNNNNPYQSFNASPSIFNDFHPKSDESSLDSIFKVPKTEPEEFESDQSPPFFNLPNLCSLEEQNLVTESTLLVTQSPPYQQLNSQLNSAQSEKKVREKEVARRRRHRIREKIDSLKKLLPSKEKMDITKVLENACKYIKFLEAQVSVLEGMPAADNLVTSAENVNNGPNGLMNRNRVLQIMVNSEVSQGILSSKGMCVYSVEQLVDMIGRLFTTEEASVILNSVLFSSFTPL